MGLISRVSSRTYRKKMSGWEQILHSESEEEDFVPAKVAKANNGQQILQNGQPLLGKNPPSIPPSFHNQQNFQHNNYKNENNFQHQQTFQNGQNLNQTNGNHKKGTNWLPSYPNSLFDIFEQKLKDEDFESQTFFHCNVDAKNNCVEVFLNDKRYFVQPNRKLPCDLKHIIAKYIFSIYDHGDVKYPFDNNKIDNVLQEIYKWDASNKFIQLEPAASFEVVEKTDDNVTVLLEIDDEEIMRTMASSMELARNIASKQMLNSETYKEKYIELLKKEAEENKKDYEFSGPVIEKFGNPRHDPHIRDRLNSKKNVHLDVICGN